jgi:Cap4 SAVED domain
MSSEDNLHINFSSIEATSKFEDSTRSAESPAVDLWSVCSKKILKIGQVEILLYEPLPDASNLILTVSERLREHYIAEAFLKKLGRDKVVQMLRQKIPLRKKGKSGDLGEILATEFVNSGQLPFQVPIHRLRWKDSRELPMRGEDLIGFQFDVKPLRFLKGEAKSRERLNASVLSEARAALDKNDGLPLAHTLGFIMERLLAADEDEKASMIEEYVLRQLPGLAQVSHLIFTFSQNDPSELLQGEAKRARKPITHYSVGLRVLNHQRIIEEIYSRATNG